MNLPYIDASSKSTWESFERLLSWEILPKSVLVSIIAFPCDNAQLKNHCNMEMVFYSSYTHISRKPCMKVKDRILSILWMRKLIDFAAINLKWFSFINTIALKLNQECKSKYCDKNSFGIKSCAMGWLVIIHVDGSTSWDDTFNLSTRLPFNIENILSVYPHMPVSDFLSRQRLFQEVTTQPER